MKVLSCLVLLAMLGLALPAPAGAVERPADESMFVEGARYDAVLHRHERRWRLLPARGNDVKLKVAAGCRTGEPPPPGLWLLTRDASGPVLVAPSATPLPEGHPGQIRLLGCDEALPAGSPAMGVPRALLDWLSEHSGAIHVTD